MLIVIEGIDGSGKTTQTELLIKKLKSAGYKTATLNFPQYEENFFGGLVKQFLQGEFGQINQVDPHLASILYALDRWETVSRINKWLKQGRVIVLNRYVPSNLIHQVVKIPPIKRQRFIEWIEQMEYNVLKIPKPDLVIYLDLPYQVACALIEKRGNKKDIHEADLEHLKRAAEQGCHLAKERRDWQLIDCSKRGKILTREEIGERVWKALQSRI
jgi:dTMP kinase